MQTEYNLADFSFERIDEDSPDLTDDEVANAIPLKAPKDIEKQLGLCPTCQGAAVKLHYARRRRKPCMYWRITAGCEQGHERQLVFRIDFL